MMMKKTSLLIAIIVAMIVTMTFANVDLLNKALVYNPLLLDLSEEAQEDVLLAAATGEFFAGADLMEEYVDFADYVALEEDEFALQNDSGYSASTTTYTVVSGDMLSKIAQRFGTTVAAIMAANPSIKNANVINVGQKIKIPSGSRPAPTPSPTPSPAPSDSLDATRKKVVQFALSWVGRVPYVYGATPSASTNSPSAWDCSSYVQWILHKFGYNISRTTYTQIRDGAAVNGLGNAKPADLVLYDGHVAMITSCSGTKCAIVHARSAALGTGTSPDAAYRTIIGIRRIIR